MKLSKQIDVGIIGIISLIIVIPILIIIIIVINQRIHILESIVDTQATIIKMDQTIIDRFGIVDPHQYQISIDQDSTYIYSDNKLLKALSYDSTQTIDKFFLKDNE